MVHFKEGTTSDIPLIRQLSHTIWPLAYGSILSKEQMDYMLNRMYSESSLLDQMNRLLHHFILVFNEDTPVGYASWSWITDGNLYRLHKIYLVPSQHGKGIGRQLLQHVIRNIAPTRETILELNVNRRNKAIDFYTREGFRIVRSEDNDIGNGYYMNDYVMQKTIGPA